MNLGDISYPKCQQRNRNSLKVETNKPLRYLPLKLFLAQNHYNKVLANRFSKTIICERIDSYHVFIIQSYAGIWIEKCLRKKRIACKYCWFFIIFKIKISVRRTTLTLVSKNQVAFYFNIGHFMFVTSLNNWFIVMKLGLNLFVAKQNAKVCCQLCFLFRI